MRYLLYIFYNACDDKLQETYEEIANVRRSLDAKVLKLEFIFIFALCLLRRQEFDSSLFCSGILISQGAPTGRQSRSGFAEPEAREFLDPPSTLPANRRRLDAPFSFPAPLQASDSSSSGAFRRETGSTMTTARPRLARSMPRRKRRLASSSSRPCSLRGEPLPSRRSKRRTGTAWNGESPYLVDGWRWVG